MRGSNTSEIIFENCEVPAENRIGKEGQGVYILMTGLDYERLVMAGMPMGLIQASCDISFDYAHQRKAFGSRIGEFQLIQAKLADMYVSMSAARSYLYSTARLTSAGTLSSKDCSGAVLYVSELSTKIALEAIQILGGNGYINDYPTGRLLRDSKLCEIGGGTSEIRRLVIGRAINKEYS